MANKNQSPSKDIGKTGNMKNTDSSGGAQLPFLPSANSYPGRMGGNTNKGKTNTTSKPKIPFLPDKPK